MAALPRSLKCVSAEIGIWASEVRDIKSTSNGDMRMGGRVDNKGGVEETSNENATRQEGIRLRGMAGGGRNEEKGEKPIGYLMREEDAT